MCKPQLTLLLLIPPLVLSATAHALVLGNAKIDSSSGDPLYAEISFSQAQSRTPIKVSIAQPFEQGIAAINDDYQSAQYNFYVRQNQSGSGIIVVTTSTPFTSQSVNLTLKVEDDGDTRYQQIKRPLPTRVERLKADLQTKPLQPQVIVNEADIALDLPISRTLPPPLSNTPATASRQAIARNTSSEPSTSNYSTTAQVNTAQSASAPLVVTIPSTDRSVASASKVTEQGLSSSAATSTIVTPPDRVATVATSGISTPLNGQTQAHITRQTQRPEPVMLIPQSSAPQPTPSNFKPHPAATKPINQPQSTSTTTTKPLAPQKPTNSQPVLTPKTSAMPSSTTTNTITKTTTTMQKHTVQANENLWKISMAVAAQNQMTVQQAMRQIRAVNQQAFINGNSNLLRQGAVLQLPMLPQTMTTQTMPAQNATAPTKKSNFTAKQSASNHEKPRETAVKQSAAHLSIVAGEKGNSQGGVDRHTQHAATAQLITSLKNRRRSTLALQQDVNDMDQKLQQKLHRLALINNRLAQLEQQLKQQPIKKTQSEPAHKLRSFHAQPANNLNAASDTSDQDTASNDVLRRFYSIDISTHITSLDA